MKLKQKKSCQRYLCILLLMADIRLVLLETGEMFGFAMLFAVSAVKILFSLQRQSTILTTSVRDLLPLLTKFMFCGGQKSKN